MKKIVNFLLALLVVFGLTVVYEPHQLHVNAQSTEFSIGGTDGYKIIINSNNWQGNEIIVSLHVPSTASVTTIFGDIAVRRFGYADNEWHVLDDVEHGDFLYEGSENIVIAPDETKIIARIQAGNPMSWRSFYQPIDIDLQLKINAIVDTTTYNAIETNNVITFPYHESIKIYDPETEDHLWNIYDDDLVFFANDAFRMDFTGFPTGWEKGVGPTFYPNGEGYPTARVYFMVSYDGGPPQYGTGEAKILEEAVSDDQGRWYMNFEQVNGTMSVRGTVADDLPQVALGYEIHLYASDDLKNEFSSDPTFNDYIVVGPRPIIYEEGAIENSYDFRLIFFGIDIPEFDHLQVYPHISELGNLYDTEYELNFANPTKAIITFSSAMNVMGIFNYNQQEGGDRYFVELANLEDSIEVIANPSTHILSTEVDTSLVRMLAGVPATIQFLKASQRLGLPAGVLNANNFMDYLTIEVFDSGQQVIDLSSYIDLEEVTYDPLLDKLVLPVKHFTKYQVGLTQLGLSAIPVSQVFTPVTYTLTMVTNCGKDPSSINQPQGSALSLSEPTRVGYSFEGWYWNEQFSMPFLSSVMPAGDTTIYAKWALQQQLNAVEKSETTLVYTNDLLDKINFGDLTLIESLVVALDVENKDIGDIQQFAYDQLSAKGLYIASAYKIEILKTIVEQGKLPFTSKVSNDEIVEPITLYLPVPAGLDPTKLVVIYISPNKEVEILTSEIVKENGNTYLAFQTNHFSFYAIAETELEQVEDDEEVTPPTTDNQYNYWFLLFGLFFLISSKGKYLKQY